MARMPGSSATRRTTTLVVLDLGLPKLDGLQVLKRWRANSRTMPILVLTARDSWSEKVDAIDAGADDYLTKPFRMEELLARVRCPPAASDEACERRADRRGYARSTHAMVVRQRTEYQSICRLWNTASWTISCIIRPAGVASSN